ncbi:unnamed protein product [Urochloa humidicola]
MASQLQPLRGSWLLSQALPVINIDRLSMGAATRAPVIQEIALACREQGCFQVVNHGISKSVMKGLKNSEVS